VPATRSVKLRAGETVRLDVTLAATGKCS
jgi:hypothetical protein